MNIFILDDDPVRSARYHVDRHLVSQTKESLQLLGTAFRLTTEGAPDWVYKSTHASHPCGVWTRESLANWTWLRQFAFLLVLEGRYRYGRVWEQWLNMLAQHPVPNLPDRRLTPFAQAMPEDLRSPTDPVLGYRRYYNENKQHLFSWKRRAPPPWIRYSNLSSGQRIQRQLLHTTDLVTYDVQDDSTWPEELRLHLRSLP